MRRQKFRGLTTVEALLIAAGFIIVGVIGALTFQQIGKSAAEALRANAIVTADRGGFDVTVEVLNGRLLGLALQFGQAGSQQLSTITQGSCAKAGSAGVSTNIQPSQLQLVAGQSATCRFSAQLTPGTQYVYVIIAYDGSGKAVQIAKGVVSAGIS
ncbi:MAG: hypothetical protein ACPL3C_05890 [Pyrobaculum sp.]|uniref:hypothetical protein n=1 Tax=Pyrobaculum sp. TaxID=2004705 RepID=UPI003CBC1CAE